MSENDELEVPPMLPVLDFNEILEGLTDSDETPAFEVHTGIPPPMRAKLHELVVQQSLMMDLIKSLQIQYQRSAKKQEVISELNKKYDKATQQEWSEVLNGKLDDIEAERQKKGEEQEIKLAQLSEKVTQLEERLMNEEEERRTQADAVQEHFAQVETKMGGLITQLVTIDNGRKQLEIAVDKDRRTINELSTKMVKVTQQQYAHSNQLDELGRGWKKSLQEAENSLRALEEKHQHIASSLEEVQVQGSQFQQSVTLSLRELQTEMNQLDGQLSQHATTLTAHIEGIHARLAALEEEGNGSEVEVPEWEGGVLEGLQKRQQEFSDELKTLRSLLLNSGELALKRHRQSEQAAQQLTGRVERLEKRPIAQSTSPPAEAAPPLEEAQLMARLREALQSEMEQALEEYSLMGLLVPISGAAVQEMVRKQPDFIDLRKAFWASVGGASNTSAVSRRSATPRAHSASSASERPSSQGGMRGVDMKTCLSCDQPLDPYLVFNPRRLPLVIPGGNNYNTNYNNNNNNNNNNYVSTTMKSAMTAASYHSSYHSQSESSNPSRAPSRVSFQSVGEPLGGGGIENERISHQMQHGREDDGQHYLPAISQSQSGSSDGLKRTESMKSVLLSMQGGGGGSFSSSSSSSQLGLSARAPGPPNVGQVQPLPPPPPLHRTASQAARLHLQRSTVTPR